MLADSGRGKLNFLGSKFLILQSIGELNDLKFERKNNVKTKVNKSYFQDSLTNFLL